jgi:hypothetical protein
MTEIVKSKIKEKFKLNSDNTRRVLEIFLNEPEKHFTYSDFRDRLEGCESQITLALRGLSHSNVLEEKGLRGRPPKPKNKKKKKKGKEDTPKKIPKEYYIFIKIETFKKVFKIFSDDNIGMLMGSHYVNILIKNHGFLEVYDIIKDNLERSEFRKRASSALLQQPALIDEYKNYREFIRGELEASSYQTIIPDIREDPNVLIYPPPPRYNLFKPLSNLNLQDSIMFYRKKINNIYIKFYRHLTRNYRFSEGMRKYVDLDIFLSPLTSFPVNDPIHLLFAKPFERLYDDIYIIENADFYKIIKRAYIVYSCFSDILSSGIFYLKSEKLDNLDWNLGEIYKRQDQVDESYQKEELKTREESLWYEMDLINNIDKSLDVLAKSAIFYWNAASRRLDTLFNKIDYLRGENGRNGKYHIFSDNRGLKIRDLEKNSIIVSSDINEGLIDPYFLLYISADKSNSPFFNLRPCHIFYEQGLKLEERTYDDILAELNLLINQ